LDTPSYMAFIGFGIKLKENILCVSRTCISGYIPAPFGFSMSLFSFCIALYQLLTLRNVD